MSSRISCRNVCNLFPWLLLLAILTQCAAAPRISEVVQETKTLIRQSREKLVIAYVIPMFQCTNVAWFTFHLLDLLPMIYLPMIPLNTMFLWLLVPPPASWPSIWANLSLSIGKHLSNTLGRIGLEYIEYVLFHRPLHILTLLIQVAANKSKSVTKISSLGMWLPIHDEEWDGDIPLGLVRFPRPCIDAENGKVTFKANTLPWLVGRYEVSSYE